MRDVRRRPRGITILRDLPWRPVWRQDGRRPNAPITRYPPWLRELRGASGVYFFRDAVFRDLTLYVGRAVDLYDRIRRHFTASTESPWRPHRHVAYDRTTIEVRVYVLPAEQIRTAEAIYIRWLQPRDNVRAEHAAVTRVPGADDLDTGADHYADDDDDDAVPW